jgi:hypothetical protein
MTVPVPLLRVEVRLINFQGAEPCCCLTEIAFSCYKSAVLKPTRMYINKIQGRNLGHL